METDNKIQSVGIDYFTVTARLSDAGELWKQAKEVRLALEQTVTAKPWRFFSYEGFVYKHPALGHFAWGESSNELQGVVVQASGLLSDRYLLRFMSPMSRWARVDLQTDVKLYIPRENLASECYDWIIRNGIKARKYSLIQNTAGGETLYVGSRVSDDFGRLYDKGVETGQFEPGRLWRYETEFKADKAEAAAQSLAVFLSRSQGRSHAISATVYDWFDKRQVPPVYHRNDATGLDLRSTLEGEKTDDMRLTWIRKQVSPAVRDMLSRGNREVLEALGITDFYTVRRRSK